MEEMRQSPAVGPEKKGRQLTLHLRGDWKISEVQPDFDQLLKDLHSELDGVAEVCLCGKEIGAWDTSILPALQILEKFASERDLTFNLGQMPQGVRELYDLARAVPERADSRRHERRRDPFFLIGEAVIRGGRGFREWFEFIGRIATAFYRMAIGTARVRKRDFFLIVEEVGARAFPIVTLISFLVGVIIAFLGIVVLTRFNAEYYVSYLVGYGMLREMGALMTGVILSGRTGAAFAAHIGSMKVNEEIDALKAMGVSPVEFLVIPRILALLLMMPLLTIYADVIGIISGAMVASEMSDMAIPIFTRGLREAVTLNDFGLGIVKSFVFGLIIAISGCIRGFQCGNDSSAVGQAATSAVVTSITLIVAFNALIDWIAALYGI